MPELSKPLVSFGSATAVERIGSAAAVLIAVAGFSLFEDSAIRLIAVILAACCIVLASFLSNRLHWMARWHLVDGLARNPISTSWRVAEMLLTVVLAFGTAGASLWIGSDMGTAQPSWAAALAIRSIGAVLLLLAVAYVVRPLTPRLPSALIALGYAASSAGLWIWADRTTHSAWRAEQATIAALCALALGVFVVVARRTSYLRLRRPEALD